MEQQGINWLKWRKQGIGGSDVAAVLGISPYRTAHDLYLEKIDPNDPVEINNWAMERGKRFEPEARAHFELELGGRDFGPKIIENDKYPFLRCSLDGRSENNEICEFKYVGKVKDKIPEHHLVQMQYCLMIAQAGVCYYVPYDIVKDANGEEHVKLHQIVSVLSDKAYQEKIFYEVRQFWEENVVKKIPPGGPIIPTKGFVPLQANGLYAKLTRWKRVKEKMAELQSECEDLEGWLKPLVTLPKMEAFGVQFLQVNRVGSIDYQKIPELQGLDLDKYRKAGTTFVTMKVKDGKEN